jgi:hypothetical protein
MRTKTLNTHDLEHGLMYYKICKQCTIYCSNFLFDNYEEIGIYNRTKIRKNKLNDFSICRICFSLDTDEYMNGF